MERAEDGDDPPPAPPDCSGDLDDRAREALVRRVADYYVVDQSAAAVIVALNRGEPAGDCIVVDDDGDPVPYPPQSSDIFGDDGRDDPTG